MTITDAARPATSAPLSSASPAPPEIANWRDALVELLVLAEHGDASAASRLRGWLSVDPAAEAACARILRDVRTMRAA